MKRNWIAIVILLGLIFWGVYDYSNKEETGQTGTNKNNAAADISAIPEGLKVGNRAPQFTLETKDGDSIELSDYLGKTVFLNFWASWCPPCKVEMPYMQDFYEEYQDKDTVIFSVNMTHLESNSADATAFLEKIGVSFPVVYDHKGTVTDQYQVFAYPTTYVINAQGLITDRFQGAIDHSMMVKAYEKSL